MDKGKEIATDLHKTYYQMDEYEGGTTQTLSFKPETYQKIQDEQEELSIKRYLKRNGLKEIKKYGI